MEPLEGVKEPIMVRVNDLQEIVTNSGRLTTSEPGKTVIATWLPIHHLACRFSAKGWEMAN